jgi:hypothetical protein
MAQSCHRMSLDCALPPGTIPSQKVSHPPGSIASCLSYAGSDNRIAHPIIVRAKTSHPFLEQPDFCSSLFDARCMFHGPPFSFSPSAQEQERALAKLQTLQDADRPLCADAGELYWLGGFSNAAAALWPAPTANRGTVGVLAGGERDPVASRRGVSLGKGAAAPAHIAGIPEAPRRFQIRRALRPSPVNPWRAAPRTTQPLSGPTLLGHGNPSSVSNSLLQLCSLAPTPSDGNPAEAVTSPRPHDTLAAALPIGVACSHFWQCQGQGVVLLASCTAWKTRAPRDKPPEQTERAALVAFRVCVSVSLSGDGVGPLGASPRQRSSWGSLVVPVSCYAWMLEQLVSFWCPRATARPVSLLSLLGLRPSC